MKIIKAEILPYDGCTKYYGTDVEAQFDDGYKFYINIRNNAPGLPESEREFPFSPEEHYDNNWETQDSYDKAQYLVNKLLN